MRLVGLVLLLAGLAAGLPSHHDGHGRFRNPWVAHPPDGAGLIKWWLGMGPDEKPPIDPAQIPPYVPAYATPDRERIARPATDAVQVTWIGHATTLVQVGGLNILTDPIFSDRATPFRGFGPKRVARPGLSWNDLPHIDAVVISHNHFDHLDLPTIKRLGNGVQYFVGLGLKEWFTNLGITNVTELDWWQTASWRGVTFTATPAQHFSGRLPPFDQDEDLWAGWLIRANTRRVYFAGDTGYGPFFTEIGKRLGPIDVAILPIGAYRPRWFMHVVHVDPAEAVQAFLDAGAKHAIGMHWGTFKLSDEPMGEPPLYLRKAVAERNLPPNAFVTLKFGETVSY